MMESRPAARNGTTRQASRVLSMMKIINQNY
jgi:hypothetical protein